MLKNINISSMANLVEHTFLDAYAGESRDGSSAAKFYKGDTIFVSLAIPTTTGDVDDLSYACLALFKSHFLKMEGLSAGVCLKCKTTSKPRVVCLYVWNSLHFCYSWVLSTDQGKSMLPYLERLALKIKYDIFRVVYVSAHNLPNHHFLEQGGESKEPGQVMQN